MTSPLKAALISGAAKILRFPEGHPLRLDPAGDRQQISHALNALRRDLIALDPNIVDAFASSSFDGSPERRNLNIRLYLAEDFEGDLAGILVRALEKAWGFSGFLAAGFGLEAWRGAPQLPPIDSSAQFNLATIEALMNIEGTHVFSNFLAVSSRALEVHFGARPGGRA